jgi:hypothetical protein
MTQPANQPDPAGDSEDFLVAQIERLLVENAALKGLIEGLQARIGELERRLGLDSGRDAIAATSLAASRKRPAVPENSSLGPVPAPSIVTLGGGHCRAPGCLAHRLGAILSDTPYHHDRAGPGGRPRR